MGASGSFPLGAYCDCISEFKLRAYHSLSFNLPRQGRLEARSPYVTVLRVSHDPGIKCSARLRQFTCDQPRSRTYEVRSPGDYLEYRLLVRSLSNNRRPDRNCLQLAEVAFLGPCASSSLVLHLDASAIKAPRGSLVREWRDQSGHGHHARRRSAPTEGSAPLALPASAEQVVELNLAAGGGAVAAGEAEDDGGSPRLGVDRLSKQQVLEWESS
jgi:hypothetical protein